MKLPVRSERAPPTTGPMIWPNPKATVIRASTRRGSEEVSCRAPTNPSAVRPMKVPPRNAAAITMPTVVGRSAGGDACRLHDAGGRIGGEDADAAAEHGPEGDGRNSGEADEDPRDVFEMAYFGRTAHDRDEEGGGDDIAETEEAVGCDERPQPRAEHDRPGRAGRAPAGRIGRDEGNDGRPGEKRDDPGSNPLRLPAVARRGERRHDGGGECYADADAGEMERREMAAPGCREAFQDDRGGEDQDEGARETAGEAHEGQARRTPSNAAVSSVVMPLAASAPTSQPRREPLIQDVAARRAPTR